MYKDITLGKRVLLIILDYLVVGLLCYLVYLGCANIFFKGITIPSEFEAWVNSQGTIDELVNLINNNAELRHFFMMEMQFMGIILIATFLINIIYFVLIPLAWKRQTLGRWILKAKVVREDNKDVRTGNLMMREIIGNILVNLLTCFCGIVPIMNVIFIISKNRSISDMMAGTKIVDLTNSLVKNSNSIDAEVINESYHEEGR